MELIRFQNETIKFEGRSQITNLDKKIHSLRQTELVSCADCWLLLDMEFLFECLTSYLTGERSERVRYKVEHEKRNSISTRTHVYPLYILSRTLILS